MCTQEKRISNWSQYNKALVQRGSITFWISPEAQAEWLYQGERKPGGVQIYSDHAILVAAMIKEVFSLPYRQTEGLVNSVMNLLGTDLKSPSYTQLCRRIKSLEIQFSRSAQKNKKNLCVLVDSTGIKVYGQQEWYGKKYDKKQRQLWRKMHISVDHSSQTILSATLTDAYVHDAKFLETILEEIDQVTQGKIDTVIGDGCYSLNMCHALAEQKHLKLLAPPHVNSLKQSENKDFRNKPPTPQRDAAIDFVRGYPSHQEGLKAWKKQTNFHRRSLVETAMFRLKTNFGEIVKAKSIESQQQIMKVRCAALNKMSALGMPNYA